MPKFVHTEDINAPVDTVWKIVADPSQWPFWFPDVTGASISGALQAGTTFQWQSHDKTGTGRVARVTPDQVLELEMDLGGNRATHTFEVSRHGGLFGGNGSRLQYTLQFQAPGGLIGEFVEGGNPADVAKAKNTAEKKRNWANGPRAIGEKRARFSPFAGFSERR